MARTVDDPESFTEAPDAAYLVTPNEFAIPEDQVDMTHIDIPEAEERDNKVDDKFYSYWSVFRNIFARVILDEGHKCENTRTLSHRSIFTLYAPSVWIVTATPMINRANDLLGYLVLLYRTRWQLENWKGISIEDYYCNEELEFQPASAEFSNQDEYMAHTQGERLWVCHPRKFVSLVNSGQLEQPQVAKQVLPAILGLLQLRRTIASSIRAWGEETSLADDLPIYHIVFAELIDTRDEMKRYEEAWDKCKEFLNDGLSEAGDQTTPHVPGFRNMAYHRHMSLCTFDRHMDRFLEILSKKSLAEKVKDWYYDSPDDSASMYQRLTQLEGCNPIYSDALGMASYTCARSVKLRYLCGLLVEGIYSKDEAIRGKTIIMCQWPLEI